MDEKTKTLLRKKLEENERRIAQADEKARAIQDSVADLRKESRRIKARLRYERRKSETEDLRAQRDALEAEVKRLRAESASGRVPSPAVLRPQREAQVPSYGDAREAAHGAPGAQGGEDAGRVGYARPWPYSN